MKQLSSVIAVSLVLAACADDGDAVDLEHRAYVVAQQSDELTVIDTETRSVVGRVATGGYANHMAEISTDLATVYVISSGTDELVAVDARTLAITRRRPIGGHPTHVSLSRDGALLAVVAEDRDEVVLVDAATLEIVATIGGLSTPHFVRWSHDGATAYVANIGAHHISVIDVASRTLTGHVALDGFGDDVPAPDEGGFADVQIDHDGVLWAAHHATGRVLVYDTRAGAKLGEVAVGDGPWVAYAEHPWPELPRRTLVPSFGDRSVALIDGGARAVMATLPGDEEAYGVNFSPLAPDRAFVMNRVREDIAVVDTAAGEVVGRIPVGGNVETAATTADGRWIVAAVSGADTVVMIDPETSEVVATFDDVGLYPWSVTIPGGQNYCH